MKAKTAILLAILLAAAIGFLAVRESEWLKPDPADEDSNGVLFPEPGFAAETLTVTPAEGETLVFTRTDGDWRIAQPVQADAIDWKVEQIAALLDSLSYDRAIDPTDPDEVSAELAGMDAPLWTITAHGKGGEQRVLRVGKAVPRIGSGQARTYVQPAGRDHIFVAARSFADVLARPTSEYRELRLISTSVRRVRSARIEGRRSFTLTRSGGGWQIRHENIIARADDDKVADLLRKLTRLTAEEFVTNVDTPAKLSMYGLSRARLRVTLTVTDAATTQPADANATTHTFAFSAPSQERVFLKADDSNAVYQVGKELVETLQPDWQSLRNMRVANIQPDAVRAVTIRRDEQTTTLSGRDDKWTMTSPHKGPVDSVAVGRLIGDLADLAAVEWRDNPPSLAGLGLQPPQATVTLKTTDAETPTTLEIGSVDGSDVFVRLAGADSVAVVKNKGLAALRDAPAGLWSRSVLEVRSGERIDSIRVDRPGQERIPSYSVVRTPAGLWTLTDPVEAPADDETVQGMLHQAERMTGRRTVALGRIPDTYANAEKHLKVTLGLKPIGLATMPTDADSPSARQVVVHLVKLGEKAYAWRESEEPLAVREVPAGVFADFDEELRKRDLFGGWDESDLKSLTIAAPSGEWTLTRSEGQWTGEVDGNDVSPDKVLSLVENLLATRAEWFVAHEKVPPKRHGLDKPAWTFTLTPTDGDARSLRIAAETVEGFAGRPASLDGVTGVFTLPAWRVDGLAAAVDRLGKAEGLPQPSRPAGVRHGDE